jgi:DNA repair exonuclease SbcCD ATPase subunit
MSSAAMPVAHERVTRWLEEGQGQFSALLGILNDYRRLQRLVETNEQELEQLRGLQYEVEKLRNQLQSSESECGKLRHEVGVYRGESERHVKEREDIATSLTRSMNEALARLRGEPA